MRFLITFCYVLTTIALHVNIGFAIDKTLSCYTPAVNLMIPSIREYNCP